MLYLFVKKCIRSTLKCIKRNNQQFKINTENMRTHCKSGLNLILLSLTFIFTNFIYAQTKTVNNNKIQFELNNDVPVKIHNKINSTNWNIAQDKLYNIQSKNTSELANKLSLSSNNNSQAVLSLSVKNNSKVAMEVTVSFPILNDIHYSRERASELYYLYPKEGWAANNEDAEEDNYYSRWFPLQFVDIYDKNNGGFFVMTNDTTNYPKKYYFKKKDGKINLKVTYQTKTLNPGEVWTLPSAVIGTHTGDWHDGFYAYKNWVSSWYKPITPRKQWFQDVYNFRQIFLHTIFGEQGPWNAITKKLDLIKSVEDSEKTFGGVDYVHIFDWMREPEDRIFNYNSWNYLGGYEQLKNQIATLKKRDIRTGLYFQGYKIHRESEIGIKYGKDWEMLNPKGENYGEKGYHYPCPSAPGWQEYFTDVAKKTTALLNTDGVYFDQYGFGYLTNYNGCYNKEHGHPDIEGPVKPNYMGIGEINMWKKLRTKISDSIVTYNEEMPTDVGTQYLDATYTYAVNKSTFTPSKNPSSINLSRFLFPGFKIFEMLAVDRPFDDGVVVQLKNVFFNGEGIFLQGPLNDSGWFSDEARYTIRKTHAILSACKDAFRSNEAMPLIKTLNDSIHSNYFPSTKQNVWTFFNIGKKDFNGNILKVPHLKGAFYYDAWNFKPIKPIIKDGYAILNVVVKSKDAGCIIQSQEKVSITPPAPLTKTILNPQETIVMQTEKRRGSTFTFNLVAEGTGEVFVDWGDGKQVKYDVSKTINKPTEIKHNLISDNSEIKVFVKDRYITYLDCSASDLTRLEVDKAPMLGYLKCFNNKLKQVDLSKNIELLLFRCQNNKLTFLDLTNCIKLRDLQIGSNSITSIKGLENLYILKTLITSGNPLKQINLKGNPNLETLNVRNSGLTSLDLTENKKIVMVDITNGGEKNKNEFNAKALNDLYISLADKSGKTQGILKVIYSKDNPLYNDWQNSELSVVKNKNWKVTDSSSNTIE